MAVHTVPQDVETDDKILGPFNLRQFIYLIIVVALGGVAYLLGKIFIALAIIPVPAMLFFLILALPLKKDQPMETYLAAKISFIFKNNKRIWTPGQSETTITIATPKKKEEKRMKGLSRAEVSRRLSFLADIVDTEGYAIKGSNPNLPFNQEVYAEAESITDMYENSDVSNHIDNTLQTNSQNNRQNIINQIRNANPNSSFASQAPSYNNTPTASISAPRYQAPELPGTPDYYDAPQATNSIKPAPSPNLQNIPFMPPTYSQNVKQAQPPQVESTQPNQDMVNLANNTDFSIETIAKEANRIAEKQKPNDEVYISLH